ncbi:MAG: hypothetical protein F7B17_07730 [Desulfurococcales archaeon]|nr:hypothetical protein [Desulfurococcales archaeon]
MNAARRAVLNPEAVLYALEGRLSAAMNVLGEKPQRKPSERHEAASQSSR